MAGELLCRQPQTGVYLSANESNAAAPEACSGNPSSDENEEFSDEDEKVEIESILKTIDETGRVPCAVFQKGICTLCEKDLAKKTKQYYVVGQPDTVYSASKLVGLFGPTCGPNRTTDIAIYIRAPDAQVEDLNHHQEDYHTHAEWYTRFAKKMTQFEMQWQSYKSDQ